MSESAPAPAKPYRVLARKYRPQRFSELIGQDAMVQTLANAIRRDRLAHAFLMTGVRGVGKTSTARLIAKALNCIGPDGNGGPTIDPCGECEPCRAIAEGRHIDVIEMDAASHTGVDDVREIIEAVRYAAVSARYKIYIIDEVHMLSKNAFNALLKTLEEPPEHVKFLFATTEVNKVPVTVLSRCQRFDLRRITPDVLAEHFTAVLASEQVAADAEAVWLIANAAEGSVRDGLSILDQAIAHADMDVADGEDGKVTAPQVRAMLGLSDKGATRRLFGLLLEGEAAGMLGEVRDQYALGVEPLAMMRGLLDLVHAATVVKVGRADNPVFGDEERRALADWAERLAFPVLHRLWQLLLKGHDEVTRAAQPVETAEMALLRTLHAATMPDPGELARLIEGGLRQGPSADTERPVSAEASGGAQAQAHYAGVAPIALRAPANDPAPRSASAQDAAPMPARPMPANDGPATPPAPPSLGALCETLFAAGKYQIGQCLHDYGRVVSLDAQAPAPQLVLALVDQLPRGFDRDLADALSQATAARWTVRFGEGVGEPSLLEREQADAAAEREAILDSPLVKAALASFPDAKLILPTDRKAS